MGIRSIVMSQVVAQHIAASTGLLPGCVLATSFARGFMIPLLTHLKQCQPKLTIRVFVDGVKLRAVGDTPSDAAKAGAEAVVVAAKLFEAAKCKVSDKTILLASCAAAAKEMLRRIQNAGYDWLTASAARDLGGDTSYGARRSTKVRSQRQSQAARRAQAVANLVRSSRKFRNLVRPGLAASMRMGHRST